MKRIISIPIAFLLGYSIPEVLTGNFIWFTAFIPCLVFLTWTYFDIFKNKNNV